MLWQASEKLKAPAKSVIATASEARPEAIQKANGINVSLDRHVGLRPPRDDGLRPFLRPARILT
jgi:hypothetical protein